MTNQNIFMIKDNSDDTYIQKIYEGNSEYGDFEEPLVLLHCSLTVTLERNTNRVLFTTNHLIGENSEEDKHSHCFVSKESLGGIIEMLEKSLTNKNKNGYKFIVSGVNPRISDIDLVSMSQMIINLVSWKYLNSGATNTVLITDCDENGANRSTYAELNKEQTEDLIFTLKTIKGE